MDSATEEVRVRTSLDAHLEVRPEDSVSQVEFQLRRSSAAKKAALSARAKALKELQEWELREFQCKQQREYLELKMQLAEAEAEEQQCDVLTARKTVDQSVVNEPVVASGSALNPEAAEWSTSAHVAPRSTSVYQTEGMDNIMSALSEDDEVQFGAVPLPARAADAVEVNRSVADGNDLAQLISQRQRNQQQMLEALQMPKAELFSYDGDLRW